MLRLVSAVAGIALAGGVALAGDTPAPAGAAVYFIGIADGDVLTNPVTVRFGTTGIGIAPAGVEHPNTGHHHLLVNAVIEGDDLAYSIPADENHIHFGGGQTEVTIELPPGQHTLKLLMGDHNHIPHAPPIMAGPITVTVK